MIDKQKIKSLLLHSPLTTAVAYVADDSIRGIRLAARQFETKSGSTHAIRSTEESVSYIETVYKTNIKKLQTLVC